MDSLTPAERSRNMSAIRSKGMKPEIVVRRMIHRMGYRFRLHNKSLPGKPDLVLAARNAVVLVHGCFWHQHSSPRCKIVRTPKSNLAYWVLKLRRNAERDKANCRELRSLGWRVLVVWECSLGNPSELAKKLRSFLAKTSHKRARSQRAIR